MRRRSWLQAAINGFSKLGRFSRNRQTSQPRRARYQKELRLEGLEERNLLAVLTVNTDSDLTQANGVLTLREAIQVVNAGSTAGLSAAELIQIQGSLGSEDRIEFDAGLVGHTILLEDQDADGRPNQLVVTADVEIIGLGSDLLTIDANDPSPGQYLDDYPDFESWGTRAFLVHDGDDNHQSIVVIAGLKLTGGKSRGAGGAIFNNENLTVRDSLITGNITHVNREGYDPSISNTPFENLGSGGGIASSGTLRIVRTEVADNIAGVDTLEFANRGGTDPKRFAVSDGGGVAVILERGEDLHIEDSKINGNSTAIGGGISITTKDIGLQSTPAPRITITRSSFDYNINDNSFAAAGGFYLNAEVGDIEVSHTSISNNRVWEFSGGASLSIGWQSTVIFDAVTIDGNSVRWWRDYGRPSGAFGGLSAFVAGEFELRNSTISNNRALGVGGMSISAGYGAVAIVENTTISGNLAQEIGGVDLYGGGYGSIAIRNSTITNNTARPFDDREFLGYEPGLPMTRQDIDPGIGGMRIADTDMQLSISHTIVADNHQILGQTILWQGEFVDTSLWSSNDSRDLYIPYPVDFDLFEFNLIGDSTGSGLTPASPDADGNCIGGAGVSVIDPQLDALAFNGGPTKTHALTGGVAVNGGDPLFTAPPNYDQRGVGFSRVAGGRIDIGAFEMGAGVGTQPLIVTVADDELDGNLDPNDISLREALMIAAANPGDDIIRFAENVYAQPNATITLTYDDPLDGDALVDPLLVNNNVKIEGPGANFLSVSGDGVSRVFRVLTGVTATLDGLTITGGGGTGSGEGGGAIYSEGNLTLSRVEIVGNTTGTNPLTSLGGGVSTFNGSLHVVDSTFAENFSLKGGGLFVRNTTVNIINSTFSTNIGGGIAAADPGSNLLLTNITVTNNTAATSTYTGAGLLVYGGGTVVVHNTIIAKNYRLDGTTPSDVYFRGGGFGAASSYNLIGSGGSGGLSNNDPNGNIVLLPGVSPGVGELRDNGGSTRTHALLIGSPAIDKGNPSHQAGVGGVPSFDQRGTSYGRVMNGRIDVGAFERQSGLGGGTGALAGSGSAFFADSGIVPIFSFTSSQRSETASVPRKHELPTKWFDTLLLDAVAERYADDGTTSIMSTDVEDLIEDDADGDHGDDAIDRVFSELGQALVRV